jgi:NAD-dependent DNA ligase
MDKNVKILLNPKTDILTFAASLKIEELEALILYLADKYHNTIKTIVSDEIYDTLVDILKQKNSNSAILKTVGTSNIRNKVKLDYWLGSMNKIRPNQDNNEFNSWINKYNPPYIISDKLDGISALLIYNNNTISMFTRGDGNCGTDISYLLRYISYIPSYEKILKYCTAYNIHGIKNLIDFRGELIMKKK